MISFSTSELVSGKIMSPNAAWRDQLSGRLFPYETPRLDDHFGDQMPALFKGYDVLLKLVARKAFEFIQPPLDDRNL